MQINYKHKAKLLGNTYKADNANGILKNATIAASLKHLSNFWKSFKMSLINCTVELKPKWKKYCVLSTTGNDNDNDNDRDDRIIFTIKDTKLYVPVVTLSARNNQKRQNFSVKDLRDQLIGININKKWAWKYYK